MAKGFKVWDNDYDPVVNPTNFPEGKEMPGNYATGKTINGKLVWRPVNIGTNPSYDSVIQDRTRAHVMNDDNVTINYTVNDKNLNEYKKLRAKEFLREGITILNTKYTEEFEREGAGYTADRATLRDYAIGTLKPAVQAAGTVSAVRGVTATWPDIS
jgi:hypothetical protein|tara:strand:+ start:277 stop:747 length:471 start_codon:yes stop_codon:yes gene_type:complete